MLDAYRIMRAVLDRYRKRLDWRQRHALLGKRDAGNPLYLLAALEELRTLGTYEEIGARIEALPETVTELFDWVLERLAEGVEGQKAFGPEIVGAHTSCIALGRGGMTESELQSLCAPVDVAGDFWALHRMLRPYLMHRGELVDYSHGQLREAVERRFLPDAAQREHRHAQIAGLLHGRADPLRGSEWGSCPALPPRDRERVASRCLAELLWHLESARQWNAVVATLTDVGFLEARCSAGQTGELVADCARLTPHGGNTESPSQRRAGAFGAILARALGSIAELVGPDPSSLLSQLHLELDESVAPESAELLSALEASAGDRVWLRRTGRTAAHGAQCLAHSAFGHNYVHYLRFSENGEKLLFCDWDGVVSLWAWQEGLTTASSPPTADVLRTAAFLSPTKLLVGGEKGLWLYDNRRLWEDASAGIWRQLDGAEDGGRFSAVAASPGDYGLAAQAGRGGPRLLRVDAGSGEITHRGRLPAPTLDAFANYMAISEDGRIRALCLGTGELVTSLGLVAMAHPGGAYHCEFLAPDSALATCGNDGSLAVWDPSSGLEHRLGLPLGGAADYLAFSACRQLLAVGHRNGAVSLVQLEGRRLQYIGDFHPPVRGWAISMAFSDCGHYLAVAGRGGAVRVFDVDAVLSDARERWGDQRLATRQVFAPRLAATILPDHQTVLFLDGGIRLFSTRPDVSTRDLPLQCGGYCTDDTSGEAVAALPGRLAVLDALTGAPRSEAPAEGASKAAMAASTNGQWVATLEDTGVTLYRRDGSDGALRRDRQVALGERLASPLRWGVPMVVSRDGAMLAAAIERRVEADEVSPGNISVDDEREHEVHLLDVESVTWAGSLRYEGHCTALCADRTGDLLAVGLGDVRASIRGLEGSSLGGQYFVVREPCPAVLVFSLASRSLLCRLEAPESDLGVRAIALDSALDLLVATFGSGRVRVGRLAPEPRWLTSVHLADPLLAVRLGQQDGRLSVSDDGTSSGGWPVVHSLTIARRAGAASPGVRRATP